MSQNPDKCIALPDLSDEHWRLLFDACVGPVSIPATSPSQTGTHSPARDLIVTMVMADHALDELSETDPHLEATIGPFMRLTEAQAIAALSANNVLWATGQTPWHVPSGIAA